MAERLLVSLDIDDPHNGLDLKVIQYLGGVKVTVNKKNFQAVCTFHRQYFDHLAIFCDCSALENLDDIISLLNYGSTKVFITYWQRKVIVEDRLLVDQDLHRLILSIDRSMFEEDPEDFTKNALNKIKAFVPGAPISIEILDKADWKALEVLRLVSEAEHSFKTYVTLVHNVQDHLAKAITDGHIPCIPASMLTINPEKYSYLLPAHLLITTGLQSDRPDRLFPTVVTDENGICLGLVYSNEKSVETALQTGCGVYHSRRHGLWVKGQESGNTQELISIGVDCDADALQFKVRQKGEGN